MLKTLLTVFLLQIPFPGPGRAPWSGGGGGSITRVNVTTGTGDIGATTIAATAASHTTGNALVVFVVHELQGQTVSSIADTAGNTYTSDASCQSFSGSTIRIEAWVALNITGNASNVVTATFSGEGDYRRILVVQYSGVATSGAREACAAGTTTGTSVTSASFSPAASGNMNVMGAAADSGTTWSAGTNYSSTGSGLSNVNAQERASAPSGSQTATYNSSTSALLVSVIMSLKP